MIVRLGLGAVLVGAVAFGLWFPGFQAQVALGTGFIAKQMCSCMLVGERSFESCRPDMMPMMDAIEAELLPSGDGVRAFVTGIAESYAYFDEATGCTLQ